jgi:hypothetical protein
MDGVFFRRIVRPIIFDAYSECVKNGVTYAHGYVRMYKDVVHFNPSKEYSIRIGEFIVVMELTVAIGVWMEIRSYVFKNDKLVECFEFKTDPSDSFFSKYLIFLYHRLHSNSHIKTRQQPTSSEWHQHFFNKQ